VPPEVCPICDAIVPRNAKSCPECGSDERTGWSDSAYAGSLGIPEENFDYDKFAAEEFGRSSPKPRGIHWVWWLTALLLLAIFLLVFVH